MRNRFLIGSALFGLAACAGNDTPYPALSDQGILPLSPENPYLGSNLFLGEQAELSHYLYNFLETRGAPQAIELPNRGPHKSRILLYYPSARELYVAARRSEREKPVQWIVTGPFRIDWRDSRELKRIDEHTRGQYPVFMIRGRRHIFNKPVQIERPHVLVPDLPEPPARKPTKVAAPKPTAPKSEEEKLAEGPFKPLNTDQQALMMSKGFAERAENGDVIHTVKKEGETLESIARWYAGGEAHAAELATLNNLKSGEPVPVGQRVRVPLRHVKQFKAMP
jgi:hypothetical protein